MLPCICSHLSCDLRGTNTGILVSAQQVKEQRGRRRGPSAGKSPQKRFECAKSFARQSGLLQRQRICLGEGPQTHGSVRRAAPGLSTGWSLEDTLAEALQKPGEEKSFSHSLHLIWHHQGNKPKEELWLDQRHHRLSYSQTGVSGDIRERRFSREHFMFISNGRTWTSTLPIQCTDIFSLVAQVKCVLCWLCLPAWSLPDKSRFSKLVLKNQVGHSLVGTCLTSGFGKQPLHQCSMFLCLRKAEKGFNGIFLDMSPHRICPPEGPLSPFGFGGGHGL